MRNKCSNGESEPAHSSFITWPHRNVSYCIYFYSATLTSQIRGVIYQRTNLFKSSVDHSYIFISWHKPFFQRVWPIFQINDGHRSFNTPTGVGLYNLSRLWLKNRMKATLCQFPGPIILFLVSCNTWALKHWEGLRLHEEEWVGAHQSPAFQPSQQGARHIDKAILDIWEHLGYQYFLKKNR